MTRSSTTTSTGTGGGRYLAARQDRPVGGTNSGGGVRPARRLIAVLVALLSAFAVSVAAPAVADQRAGSPATVTAPASADSGPVQAALLKGDPSIWPKPAIVETNLSATQSEQMVGDCPLYHLCVRNQEADGLWSAYALYYCLPAGQYYELTNFTGTVYAQNSQNVAVRLLRADNSQVDSIGALTGKNVNWNPVWKIDLC
ncbi:hypothetical protein [Promicromonospora sukumoe]|uniref:Uncharacterized protein n=1 Tax=Promicromonospora sukumoe TaxID=88382 RepID=A0A7W3J6Z8_9MICO|nr:hypothetical protein [Promicromonospora sukumoe]MBA8807380.1 hypothetical protein [Promicromonospora sukumoe]